MDGYASFKRAFSTEHDHRACLHMTIEFRPTWLDEDLTAYQDTVVRFVTTEMQPQDEQARKQGHVGHALWRRAGELGLLCSDIPEE